MVGILWFGALQPNSYIIKYIIYTTSDDALMVQISLASIVLKEFAQMSRQT